MIMEICATVALRCRGVWAYLAKREERRQAVETHREGRLRDVELEHARTAGTTAIVEALANGGKVVEIDPGGRSRLISMPERPSPPPIQWAIADQDERPAPDNPTHHGELTT
jgi:hypothetical protein